MLKQCINLLHLAINASGLSKIEDNMADAEVVVPLFSQHQNLREKIFRYFENECVKASIIGTKWPNN